MAASPPPSKRARARESVGGRGGSRRCLSCGRDGGILAFVGARARGKAVEHATRRTRPLRRHRGRRPSSPTPMLLQPARARLRGDHRR
eukprot:5607674-Pleurochrysis_carterae.AAC.1